MRDRKIQLPEPLPWPLVACTPVELERLRDAWRAGEGAAYDVVAERVRRAQTALGGALDFPPEGGQHNQWYQCDACQVVLETVDDTHHRCPGCATVYSGYPYDHVIYERRHYRLSRDMLDCAWAWAVTGASHYAQRARDVLVGYGERYLQYPLHSANQGTRDEVLRVSGGHVFEQTLNEAVWAYEVGAAYDLLRLCDVVTAADHATIRDGLLRPLATNIDAHRAGKTNWQTYHNSAFLLLGALLDDVALVRQALLDPENGFCYQMDVSVLPGGMWYENSWSYHFYTLTAVERTVETARRLGIDLYGVPQVKEMYTVGLEYRMIDGTLPRFADATTTRIPARSYEVAWHAWREPGFREVIGDAPSWEGVLLGRESAIAPSAPANAAGSELKEGAGHGILRLETADGPASAVLAFGPFGGFHGHFDKLSFVSFALGQELAHDPGRAASQAYRLPVHHDWYRPTISHNTVLVDRTSQGEAAGEAELFVDTDELAAVLARTREAYPGILHRRLLALRPGYLLVADELLADDGEEHVFDWLYHQRGDAVTSGQATAAAEVSDYGTGFEYIQDAHIGHTDAAVEAAISVGDDGTRVLVDAGGPCEVLTGTGVGESMSDRVPLLHVTRNGPGAQFVAVIEPLPGGRPPAVESVDMSVASPGRWTARVRLADGGEEVFDYAADDGAREVDGVRSEARLLCLLRSAAGAVARQDCRPVRR